MTLMEESLFDELALEGEKKKLTLQWTKGITRTEDSYRTTILLSGLKDNKVHKLKRVNTVAELMLPKQTVNAAEMRERYSHLHGIPIDDMFEAQPRLLIGLRHAKLLVGNKTRSGGDEDPIAVKTPLGWTLFGTSAPSFNIVALNN